MPQQSYDNNKIDSVLSNDDIIIGILLAVLLALQASFLQSRRSQSDFVLGPIDDADDAGTAATFPNVTTATTLFEDWKEMSQPENYILYNTNKLRGLRQQELERTEKKTNVAATDDKDKISSSKVVEQRWVLFALLLMFAPIFSFEFFLTVGRQIACSFSSDLCLPYTGD